MVQLVADIQDYEGRTVDLLMFDDMKAVGSAQLTQTLAKPGQSGALISGIQKLAQRFFLELLTDLGSLQYLPHRGCLFMLEARRGYWRTVGDVIASFNAALLTIKQNLMADERLEDPSDERFKSAELLSVSLMADRVVMHIHLTSMAGDERVVLFPLRLVTS